MNVNTIWSWYDTELTQRDYRIILLFYVESDWLMIKANEKIRLTDNFISDSAIWSAWTSQK